MIENFDEKMIALMHSDEPLTEREMAVVLAMREGHVAVLVPKHQAMALAPTFIDTLRMASQFEASGSDVTELRLLSLIYTAHPNVDEQEVAQAALAHITNAMTQDGPDGSSTREEVGEAH